MILRISPVRIGHQEVRAAAILEALAGDRGVASVRRKAPPPPPRPDYDRAFATGWEVNARRRWFGPAIQPERIP